MKEAKRLPFASRFVSLGVVVDLKGIRQGTVEIDNKPGRVEEIEAVIRECLASNILGFKVALSLLGKVRFGEAQLMGKVSAPLTRMLTAWALSLRHLRPCPQKQKQQNT